MFLNGMNVLADNELFAQSKPGKALAQQALGFIDIGARGGARPGRADRRHPIRGHADQVLAHAGAHAPRPAALLLT